MSQPLKFSKLFLGAAMSASYGQVAHDDPTTESQRLVFDEIAGSADLLVSYAIGLREAARRDDRERVHAYLGDISKQFISARDAYNRIRELAKLRGRQ
jgi:hypothetical protein